MSAVAAWVWTDLRSRVRSLVILALLIALTTGVVLAAVAGARRGSTAADRLLDRTLPATVAVLPNEPGFDWDAVAALPTVESLSRFSLTEYEVEGAPPESLSFVFLDPTVMRDIERPVVLEGRLADPARADEVVITPAWAGQNGKGIGDTVTIRLLSPEEADGSFLAASAASPTGPTVEATIVGEVLSPWFSDTNDTTTGVLAPTPALFTDHPDSFTGATGDPFVNAIVRLEGGAADIAAFREQLAEVSGRRDIEFLDLAAEADHAREVADFEANALLAFAAAALVAAVFLVGQSVTRFVAASGRDLQVLQSMGMTPTHLRIAAATGPVVAGCVGTAVGVIGAYLASGAFPIGTAAPIEPSPGGHADLLVLGVGSLGLLGLVVGGSWLASWSVVRSGAASAPGHRSRAMAVASRVGAPVPAMIGVGFALDRGRGPRSLPVLPALVGAVVGVLGVVGALTFEQGVSDAAAHPERFGQLADLESYVGISGEDFVPADALVEQIVADPDVEAVNDTRQGVAESGSVDLPVFSLDPHGSTWPIVLEDGRSPSGPDEATLGPATASELGAGVGDDVELTGSGSPRTYRVSGIAFVPEGPHNSYESGAWMTPEGYAGVADGFKFHVIEVQVREGVDPNVVAARIGTEVAAAIGDPSVADEVLTPTVPPSELQELQEIQRLPRFLAGFLALLAVGAIGHALVTTVRRRSLDLAVLRALGLTRPQSRATIVAQAVVLAAVGLVFGVPLGFALGRTLWRSVATNTPVLYIPPVAVGALVLIAPIALLVALALAGWPSHRAARLRVAHVLRTE